MTQSLADAEETKPSISIPAGTDVRGIESNPVVFNSDLDVAAISPNGYCYFLCLGVFDNVDQQLAHRLEEKNCDILANSQGLPDTIVQEHCQSIIAIGWVRNTSNNVSGGKRRRSYWHIARHLLPGKNSLSTHFIDCRYLPNEYARGRGMRFPRRNADPTGDH
jgi:hypothetical protein